VQFQVLATRPIVLFNHIFEKNILAYAGKSPLGVGNLFAPRKPFENLCASLGGQPRNRPALGRRNINGLVLQAQVAPNFCAASKRICTHDLLDCGAFMQSETALNRVIRMAFRSMLALTLQGNLIPLLYNPELDGAIASN
jgi:hypothetical protein